MKVLNAHGYPTTSSNPNDFVYVDIKKSGEITIRKVNNWIKKNEKNYESLLIHVCNHNEFSPSLEEAFIIYGKQPHRTHDFSLAGVLSENNIVIHVPEKYRKIKTNYSI